DTDFAGISIAANVPLVITAHPSVPAGNLREFVTLLQKDRTLKYNYGSTGPGSYMNIVGEVMKRDEKIDMAHIPLKGAAPLKQELLAGRLQLGGDQLSSSLADIRKGSLKALATNAPQRLSALPEVPTVRELGLPKLEAEGWNGLFAPAAPFAAAQDYPAREIRSLCNYAPGSGADLIVRFYSDRLSKLAGRPVIVENRVGANGMIASDALAKSRPDGYTIMITPASS